MTLFKGFNKQCTVGKHFEHMLHMLDKGVMLLTYGMVLCRKHRNPKALVLWRAL